jgi:hypothetical protein
MIVGEYEADLGTLCEVFEGIRFRDYLWEYNVPDLRVLAFKEKFETLASLSEAELDF